MEPAPLQQSAPRKFGARTGRHRNGSGGRSPEAVQSAQRAADRSRVVDTGYGHAGKRFRMMDTDQRFRTPGPQYIVVRILYNKPTRHQTGAVECLLHGADSPPIKAPDIPQTASKVSQSQYCRPNDSVNSALKLKRSFQRSSDRAIYDY